MGLVERIQWFIDAHTWGGLLPERVLAALPLAEGLYCGLVLNLSTTGKPTLEFWERIDDLARQGFVPISDAKARALCDLPRFLERLEEVSGGRDDNH
jgi:hypothetical protein